IFGIARPHNVINAVHILKKRSNALQAVSQLCGDWIQIQSPALLKISELGDFQAIQHHLPADAPGAERGSFPVVFFKLDVVFSQINPDGLQGLQVKLLHIFRRWLEDYLKLHMLVEAIGIVTVAAISRTARRLDISDFVRLRPQYAQKSLRGHRSSAHLHVIRLLQHTAALRPELLEAQNEFLECETTRVCHETY